jgi:hypothetical protein
MVCAAQLVSGEAPESVTAACAWVAPRPAAIAARAMDAAERAARVRFMQNTVRGVFAGG